MILLFQFAPKGGTPALFYVLKIFLKKIIYFKLFILCIFNHFDVLILKLNFFKIKILF